MNSIEQLEARVAPASASVTYVDLDGDAVRIIASKAGTEAPPLTPDDLAFTDGTPDGQLSTLTLTEPGFDGAKIVFKVAKRPGGDGLAHVGFINAAGVDLDRVVVKGDLGRIVAGDAAITNDPGLNFLSARSMGVFGLVTQGGTGTLGSQIQGKAGVLKVAGDFVGAGWASFGGTDAPIGSVLIGGDVIGAGDNSGFIGSFGPIGRIWIRGDLIGGTGGVSGWIFSDKTIGSIRIDGSLIGGSGPSSGLIQVTTSIGHLHIGGDIVGGAGEGSGQVVGDGLNDVRIGGNMAGGAGLFSGVLLSLGAIGDVKIGGSMIGSPNSGGSILGGTLGDVRVGGDLIGASVSGSASAMNSGVVKGSSIASVSIGGSLIAGTDASTGSLDRCGAIVSDGYLGPVKIGGSIIGNESNPALITAKGQDTKPASGFDTAIASVSVKGDVRFAQILAGFDSFHFSANADASIGKVTIGGSWVASSLVAGAQDSGAPGYGVGDTLQTIGDTSLVARIAGIVIKGNVAGSVTAGDNYGFVAQQIDMLSIGGRAITLTPGPSSPADNILLPFTDDVHVLEV